MIRVLEFSDSIIEGTRVRELQRIFPRLEPAFRQRKSYDEYYYQPTLVEIDLDRIEELNDLSYGIEIDGTRAKILW